MSNVLLVCSGGMSSGVVLKNLEKEFQKLGEPLQAKAVGSGQAQDEISKKPPDPCLSQLMVCASESLRLQNMNFP